MSEKITPQDIINHVVNCKLGLYTAKENLTVAEKRYSDAVAQLIQTVELQQKHIQEQEQTAKNDENVKN